jgi:hypothetical protein
MTKLAMRTFFLVSLCLFSVWALGQGVNVVETNVCNLVAHPARFNNKQVRIRAQLISSIHGAALLDDHCTGKGLAFWTHKEAENQPDLRNLDDILVHHGSIGTVDKTIIGTFTGRFLRSQRVPGTHKKTMVLEVTKIDDLNVKYDRPQGHLQTPTALGHN